MGNGATSGIPAGTTLSAAEVRALLGDRFHQSRFDELAAETGGTVTVEQLKHEITGSIRSHHYPPDYRPRAHSRDKGDSGSSAASCSSDGGDSKSRSAGLGSSEQLAECKTGQRGGRNGIYSEHFPPNYQQQQMAATQ